MSKPVSHASYREARPHAWRVSASMAPSDGQMRLVVNAMRDTGAATELTSTAYLTADAGAALAKAEGLAIALGGAAGAIAWGPPPNRVGAAMIAALAA